jgi:DNA polymerase
VNIKDKQERLDQIIKQMEVNVAKLPLVSSPQEVVPAEGSPDAEIMFIGEAAGYHELQQRRPFVGAAGQLLTETLKINDLVRDDVWISNVVKARPPGNRDPRPEEIEAFRPYLDQEIEIIGPKIIATLGRFSMAKFLGAQVRISQVHGQPRWVNFPLSSSPDYRVVVLPMFHPAAALRSTNVKVMFQQDFKKLAGTLEKLNDNHDKIESEATSGKVSQEAQTDQSNEQLSLI